MTRSSQHIHEDILDFDDNFERTLRRKRKNPEPNSFEEENQWHPTKPRRILSGVL